MTPVWRKSTHSGTGGSQSDCVEVAKLARNLGVRDSKDPNGPRLVLDAGTAAALVADIKQGRHDSA
ncbi:DUF397 domain-containing protein [Actinomadura gamaensis]|uniref:DUF397 domain-containing protein n=1 Tax=Actinomadura gamaensis TaxID=1763541 RepID=A0ABV9UAL8_9ACTN